MLVTRLKPIIRHRSFPTQSQTITPSSYIQPTHSPHQHGWRQIFRLVQLRLHPYSFLVPRLHRPLLRLWSYVFSLIVHLRPLTQSTQKWSTASKHGAVNTGSSTLPWSLGLRWKSWDGQLGIGLARTCFSLSLSSCKSARESLLPSTDILHADLVFPLDSSSLLCSSPLSTMPFSVWPSLASDLSSRFFDPCGTLPSSSPPTSSRSSSKPLEADKLQHQPRVALPPPPRPTSWLPVSSSKSFGHFHRLRRRLLDPIPIQQTLCIPGGSHGSKRRCWWRERSTPRDVG